MFWHTETRVCASHHVVPESVRSRASIRWALAVVAITSAGLALPPVPVVEQTSWMPSASSQGSVGICRRRPRSMARRRFRVACKSLAPPPTLTYIVIHGNYSSPSSIRFEPRVFERLSAFVAAHRDLTLSSATSRLVDEALRMREHPLITFKDGRPDAGSAGRRSDVWEVIGAIRSVREAEPALAGDEVLAVVAETSGTPVPFIRAALAYWSDYPEEVDDFLHRHAPRPNRQGGMGTAAGTAGTVSGYPATCLTRCSSTRCSRPRSPPISLPAVSTAVRSLRILSCALCRTWRSSRRH